HGDFHPQNVLMSGRIVTGVLDWPNAMIADPAYDVAATRIILACAPMEMAAMPVLKRWAARALRPVLLARHLAGYERRPNLARSGVTCSASAGLAKKKPWARSQPSALSSSRCW